MEREARISSRIIVDFMERERQEFHQELYLSFFLFFEKLIFVTHMSNDSWIVCLNEIRKLQDTTNNSKLKMTVQQNRGYGFLNDVILVWEREDLWTNFQETHILPLAALVRTRQTTLFVAKTLLWFIYPYKEMGEVGPARCMLGMDKLVFLKDLQDLKETDEDDDVSH